MRSTVTCAATSAIRSPISAQPGPGREVDEELAVALGPGDRRGDDRARAEAVCLRGRDDPLQHLAVDRRVANHAVVCLALAGLELGLHERDQVPPLAGLEGRKATGASTRPERDERHVDAGQLETRSGRLDLGEVWGVRALEGGSPANCARSRSASWPRPTSRA